MGRSETATASLGIKIILSDLVEQITETNAALIKKMLNEGYIEDSNEFYNETYRRITYYDDYNLSVDYVLPDDYLELKEHLMKEFKTHGSILKSNYTSKELPDLHNGSLLEKKLLVSVDEIITNQRWGYNREGVNAMSIPYYNIAPNLEEYKSLTNFKVVFIIMQDAN